ncbi:MAG: hypothetical protein ACQETE_01965 [Bacteroidota bacterium]
MNKAVLPVVFALLASLLLFNACSDDPIINAPDDGSGDNGSYGLINFHQQWSAQDSVTIYHPQADTADTTHQNPELF